MKISDLAVVLFLFGCNEPVAIEEEMPVEIISCTHPDSRYEGVVQIEIEDDIAWNDIHFEISQGEYSWETPLQTEDYFFWWTEMHLIELDCFSDYEYDIIYGESQ